MSRAYSEHGPCCVLGTPTWAGFWTRWGKVRGPLHIVLHEAHSAVDMVFQSSSQILIVTAHLRELDP